MKFHLLYCDGGSTTLKSFETDIARVQWIGWFYQRHIGKEDYSVDLVFDGDILAVNSYIVGSHENS